MGEFRDRERFRRRTGERRAARLCPRCGQWEPTPELSVCAPSGDKRNCACRCPECAKRSYERSVHFKGILIWEPSFIVIEVAAALVFARFSFDRVEMISDANPVARYAGWS